MRGPIGVGWHRLQARSKLLGKPHDMLCLRRVACCNARGAFAHACRFVCPCTWRTLTGTCTAGVQARERYREEWQATQVRFVDDPSGAVGQADVLVQRVMKERGYPTDDFEQRAADISVEHPDLVERYRTAHGIAQSNEKGTASTEDLSQSVRHYRSLFETLLGGGASDQQLSRDTSTGEQSDVESPARS